MSYLKTMATSFVYIAFFLAIVTFMPGLPPKAEFYDYSVKPPAALVGVLASNDRLNNPEILFNGTIRGAESFDSYNGELYSGLKDGRVVKIVGKKIVTVAKLSRKCGGTWDEKKCGRVLGLKFDKQGSLYVADAYYGIFKVDVKTGKYEKLFDALRPIDGNIPMLFNSVDVASNGDVYWTDSSTEFELRDGVFIMLANPAGRLIRYNAATRKNEVLVKNLGFANGVKLSDDETHVIVAESMTSSIVRYNLKGPKTGKRETFIDGLPGVPDNIHSDGRGNYIVSIIFPADPENPQITQTLIPHSNIRKMLSRLMALIETPFRLINDIYPNDFLEKIIFSIGSFETTKFLNPSKLTVVVIDTDGKILEALHNSDEIINGISSAFVHDDYLWFGSPFNEYIARVPLKQAFPNGVFKKLVQEAPRIPREAPRVEKPVVKPAKIEKTTTTKPLKKSETPPTPTKAPEPAKPKKNDDEKVVEIPKRREINRGTEKKMETTKSNEQMDGKRSEKKFDDSRPKEQNVVKDTSRKQETQKNKDDVVSSKLVDEKKSEKKINEAKKPIVKIDSKEPTKKSETTKNVKQEDTKKNSKDTGEAEKPMQQETAKPTKKNEPKRSTRIVDEM